MRDAAAATTAGCWGLWAWLNFSHNCWMPLKSYKWTKILFSLEHAVIVEPRPFPKETNDTHMLSGRVFEISTKGVKDEWRAVHSCWKSTKMFQCPFLQANPYLFVWDLFVDFSNKVRSWGGSVTCFSKLIAQIFQAPCSCSIFILTTFKTNP